jgi:hypothetical protein
MELLQFYDFTGGNRRLGRLCHLKPPEVLEVLSVVVISFKSSCYLNFIQKLGSLILPEYLGSGRNIIAGGVCSRP